MGAIVNELLVDVDDRVATLTLNRPERRNALNTALLGRGPEAMAEADDAVDAVRRQAVIERGRAKTR